MNFIVHLQEKVILSVEVVLVKAGDFVWVCVLNVSLGCKESEKRGGSWGNKCRKKRRSLVRTQHTGKGGEKGGFRGSGWTQQALHSLMNPGRRIPSQWGSWNPKGSWVQTQPCELWMRLLFTCLQHTHTHIHAYRNKLRAENTHSTQASNKKPFHSRLSMHLLKGI